MSYVCTYVLAKDSPSDLPYIRTYIQYVCVYVLFERSEVEKVIRS